MRGFIRKVWLPLSLIGIMTAITIVMFHPGCLSSDSAWQWDQSKTGNINNWHTPFMAFTWHILDTVFPWFEPQYSSMFYFTSLLFWAGLVILMKCIVPSNWEVVALTFLVGFFPPVFAMLGQILKDTTMAAVVLLAYALLFAAQERRGLPRTSLILGLVMLTFAMGIRHNALFSELPLFIWAGFIFIENFPRFNVLQFIGKPAGGFIAGCLLFVLAMGAMTIADNAVTKENTYPSQQVALFDLVNISVMTGRYEVPDLAGLYYDPRQRFGIEDLRKMYHPSTLYSIYWDTDDTRMIQHYAWIHDAEEYRILLNKWAVTVISQPAAYILHRSRVFVGLMFRGANYGYCADDATFVPYAFLRKTLLFKRWLYVAIAAVSLVALLAFRKFRYYRAHLALAASGVFYAVSYYIVGTDDSPRYLYWSILACVILAVQVFTELGTCWTWADGKFQVKSEGRTPETQHPM